MTDKTDALVAKLREANEHLIGAFEHHRAITEAIEALAAQPAASVDVDVVVERLKDRVFPKHQCPAESAAVWNTALYEMKWLIDSAGEAKGGVDVACTDMGNYTDYAFPQPAEGDGAVADALTEALAQQEPRHYGLADGEAGSG